MGRSSSARKNARLDRETKAVVPSHTELGATVALAALSLGIVLCSWVFDTGAEASFDAPKRLAAILTIAVAAIALLVAPCRKDRPRPWTEAQRRVAALVGFALAWATLSACLSPRASASLDALRALALLALALPLGASVAASGRGSRILLGAFLVAALANTGVAMAQVAGLAQPYVVEDVGGRRVNAEGLIGNEGSLAQGLALAAALAAAALFASRGVRSKMLWMALLSSLLAGIVVTRNLTSFAVVVAAAGLAAAIALRRRVAVPAALAILVVALIVAAQPGVRTRLAEVASHVRKGEWNVALTNRLAPWAAAVEMVRTRPLTGIGPGLFGTEYIPYRLAAERRLRTRLVMDSRSTAYNEVHDEYLQAAAEAGLPAALAVTAAFGLLLGHLFPHARARNDEALVLFGLLAAGGLSALFWFPLQSMPTSLPLLLAAGRAWRVLGERA